MSRTTARRAAAALAGTAALAFAAGCGGDDESGGGGSGDEDAITAVIRLGVTTTDVEEKCVEAVTTGFVTAVYGDLATCRTAEAPEPDDDPPPTGVEVEDIEVDGDRATAKVTTRGGDTDGATGTITVEKEDGDWKVAELGIDYLRSQLTTGLEKGTFDADDGPLQDAGVRSCIDDGLQELDDTAFRNVAYASIRDADPPQQFLTVVEECAANAGDDSTSGSTTTEEPPTADRVQDPEGDERISLLRRQFEEGIRESATADGVTEEQLQCIFRETRESITEDEIIEQIGRGADDVDPALGQDVARAIQACG